MIGATEGSSSSAAKDLPAMHLHPPMPPVLRSQVSDPGGYDGKTLSAKKSWWRKQGAFLGNVSIGW
jgi:hypothetical protein